MSDIATIPTKSLLDHLLLPPSWLRTLIVSILLPILVTLGQRLLAYILVEFGIN